MLSLFLFYVLFCFFFFKQKTAYEMRISDWSSDVCSSDLNPPSAVGIPRVMRRFSTKRYFSILTPSASTVSSSLRKSAMIGPPYRLDQRNGLSSLIEAVRRSEEHTSELQSLMRLSYAVFCLTKKKTTRRIYHAYDARQT